MRNRSVSVTGATGFVGWHVAERLRDDGWRVRGIVRARSRNPLPAEIDRVEAGLSARDLEPAIAGSAVVIHSAAVLRDRDPRRMFDVNVGGTREVVAGANAAGARVILISSQAALGPSPRGGATREDDPSHPVNDYGRSKWEAEEVVRREATQPWTILRPSSVYGPRDRQFLPLLKLAARGRFLIATPPDSAFTFVHVHDVARAVALATTAESAGGLAFFIGHPRPATTVEVLQAAARAVGRPYRPRRLPAAAVVLGAWAGEIGWRIGLTPPLDLARLAEFRAGSFVGATDRATERLGFTAAIDLEAGFASTWKWYQENRWV